MTPWPTPADIVWAIAAAIVVADIWASVAVIRSPFYTRFQKSAQVAIVWCVPLFGALGIWAFLRAQYNWQKYDTRAFPEDLQKGTAIEVQDAIHGLGGGEPGGSGD